MWIGIFLEGSRRKKLHIKEYRPNVVGVFINDLGKILAGERTDTPGAWQLPQGGIEPGESALSALYREMREEIGCDHFAILNQSSRAIVYRFPDELIAGITSKYIGQSQTWFLLKFNDNYGPNITNTDGEFRAFTWLTMDELIQSVVYWKKEAYVNGFKSIGLSDRE